MFGFMMQRLLACCWALFVGVSVVQWYSFYKWQLERYNLMVGFTGRTLGGRRRDGGLLGQMNVQKP